MDILDKLDIYLSNEIKELIIKTLYNEFIINVKKNKEVKYIELFKKKFAKNNVFEHF